MTIPPEKMHEWYLEATKQLNPESYNQNAQKAYSDLTVEQQSIDKFIANKATEHTLLAVKEMVDVMIDEQTNKKYLGFDENNRWIAITGGKTALLDLSSLLSEEINKLK